MKGLKRLFLKGCSLETEAVADPLITRNRRGAGH